MKFLADMGISPKTIKFLQQRGYDAIHLHEQGLYRLSDTAILTKAQDEQRVLLTHDLDFGELLAASGSKLPSVVIFRLRNMRPENVNGYLTTIILQYQRMLEEGAIISLMEGKIRIRSLPVKINE
jgi:predicted nuclease of predicted toxin-antitoxin system